MARQVLNALFTSGGKGFTSLAALEEDNLRCATMSGKRIVFQYEAKTNRKQSAEAVNAPET